jgi:hypothetical protein
MAGAFGNSGLSSGQFDATRSALRSAVRSQPVVLSVSSPSPQTRFTNSATHDRHCSAAFPRRDRDHFFGAARASLIAATFAAFSVGGSSSGKSSFSGNCLK